MSAKPGRGSIALRHCIFVLFHPRYWRRWARRCLVVVFPVGIALWLIAVIALLVALFITELRGGLGRFWNAKHRKRRRNSYYR